MVTQGRPLFVPCGHTLEFDLSSLEFFSVDKTPDIGKPETRPGIERVNRFDEEKPPNRLALFLIFDSRTWHQSPFCHGVGYLPILDLSGQPLRLQTCADRLVDFLVKAGETLDELPSATRGSRAAHELLDVAFQIQTILEILQLLIGQG